MLISIGSNIGNREENIRFALNRLTAFFRIDNMSSIYETEPLDDIHQGWFLNMVVSGYFEHDPLELLKLVKNIESMMGRTKKTGRGPRVIDLDIIIFNDIVADTPELTIPHPRMTERKFVLVPIKEINPDFIHPTLNRHIDDLIDNCLDKSIIQKKSRLLLQRKEQKSR